MLARAANILFHPLGAVTLFSVGIFLILTSFTRLLKKRNYLLRGPMWALTYIVFPTLYVLAILLVLGGGRQDWHVKMVETLVGIEIIWLLLSLLRIAFISAPAGALKSRVPVLFLDVMRLALVALGSVLVVAAVWNKDLTHFLTTLGIGSIVLGLALQETLGNFFAGIALLFEQPFQVGDWIRVGPHEGEVLEINWRSVRLRDRNNILVVLPNSVIGRERIENYSRPTPICGVTATVGFSYSDPPNKVKKVLLEVMRGMHEVLSEPPPTVRTKEFGDFAVTYQIRYFISDFPKLLDIEEELKTRIWYAARRYKLNIPFPIRTIYKTEVPPQEKREPSIDPRDVLSKVPLFEALLPDEVDALARDVIITGYGDGERLVEQGGQGDSMFVIHKGNALVTIKDENGNAREVGRLGPGELFGEMALLTGERRAATVTAEGDTEVVVVYKEALKDLLAARPGLLASMAASAEERRIGLAEVLSAPAPREDSSTDWDKAAQLIGRIRKFFGIG